LFALARLATHLAVRQARDPTHQEVHHHLAPTHREVPALDPTHLEVPRLDHIQAAQAVVPPIQAPPPHHHRDQHTQQHQRDLRTLQHPRVQVLPPIHQVHRVLVRRDIRHPVQARTMTPAQALAPAMTRRVQVLVMILVPLQQDHQVAIQVTQAAAVEQHTLRPLHQTMFTVRPPRPVAQMARHTVPVAPHVWTLTLVFSVCVAVASRELVGFQRPSSKRSAKIVSVPTMQAVSTLTRTRSTR
jgi:hypothetical protein